MSDNSFFPATSSENEQRVNNTLYAFVIFFKFKLCERWNIFVLKLDQQGKT